MNILFTILFSHSIETVINQKTKSVAICYIYRGAVIVITQIKKSDMYKKYIKSNSDICSIGIYILF